MGLDCESGDGVEKKGWGLGGKGGFKGPPNSPGCTDVVQWGFSSHPPSSPSLVWARIRLSLNLGLGVWF